jgi:hypothetical protein
MVDESMLSGAPPRGQEVTNLACLSLTDRATLDSPQLVVRSKRSKGYNLLKNASVFLNIVGVAAVAAVAAQPPTRAL